MRRFGLAFVVLLLLCSTLPAVAGSLQREPSPDAVPGEGSRPAAGNSFRYLPLILRNFTVPQPWTVVTAEAFENPLSDDWRLVDFGTENGGEYHWARRTCRPFSGAHSAWIVGGGEDGEKLSCGSNYGHNLKSYMIYGPFSLADATDAGLAYKLWLKSEAGHDKFCWGASVDGITFQVLCASGDLQGWIQRTEDLSWIHDIGDLVGQPEVWVTFYFYSDGQNSEPEGAYLDEILITRCDAPSCIPVPAATTGGATAQAPTVRETHTLRR